MIPLRSGAGVSSSPLRRSLRSSTAGLQDLAKPLPTSVQIYSHRHRARLQDVGDLVDRSISVIEEDDRRSLLGWQLAQRPEKLVVDFAHLVRRLQIKADQAPPLL